MSGSQVYLLNLESQEIQKNSVAPFYDSLIDYFCNFSCHPALIGQRMRSIHTTFFEVNRFTNIRSLKFTKLKIPEVIGCFHTFQGSLLALQL